MNFTSERVIPKCPRCDSERLEVASAHPFTPFVGGTKILRDNGTLGEWWICTSISCNDGKKNDRLIKTSKD